MFNNMPPELLNLLVVISVLVATVSLLGMATITALLSSKEAPRPLGRTTYTDQTDQRQLRYFDQNRNRDIGHNYCQRCGNILADRQNPVCEKCRLATAPPAQTTVVATATAPAPVIGKSKKTPASSATATIPPEGEKK